MANTKPIDSKASPPTTHPKKKYSRPIFTEYGRVGELTQTAGLTSNLNGGGSSTVKLNI